MGERPKSREAMPLRKLAGEVQERHKHVVLGRVNDHEVKIAVNEDPSAWHYHANSDEFFLTLEGALSIEFRSGETVTLNVGEGLFVEAGAIHKTTPSGRTVNLLIERADVTTTLEDGDGVSRKGSGAPAR